MNKIKLLRYFSGGMVLLLVFILHSTVMRNIQIRGIVPNLMIITIVSFSLLRGKIDGAAAGLSLGLLQDIFFGGVIGFYAAIYLFIGYLSGYLYMNFYKDSVLIPLGVMATADVFVNMLVYFFTFLFRGRLQFHLYLGRIIIPELIYTIFLGFLFYRLLYMLNAVIEHIEWSEEYED